MHKKIEIEKILNLDKNTLAKDYFELDTLAAVARKYNTSFYNMKTCFERLGIEYQKNIKQSFNESYFENINDPNVLYWVGFLLADGCVYKDRLLKLSLSENDLNHILKFKEDTNHLGRIYTSTNRLSEQNPNWHDSKMVSIDFISTKIVLDIEKFGLIPRKTFKIKFPEILRNHKHLNVFFRGYIDGDGSWHYHAPTTRPTWKKQLSLSIRGTDDFLLSINDILIENKIIPEDRKNKVIDSSASVGNLRYIGNNICMNIAKWIYSDIIAGENNRYLDRKFEIVKDFIFMPDKSVQLIPQVSA